MHQLWVGLLSFYRVDFSKNVLIWSYLVIILKYIQDLTILDWLDLVI